jgi:hypothetical protein
MGYSANIQTGEVSYKHNDGTVDKYDAHKTAITWEDTTDHDVKWVDKEAARKRKPADDDDANFKADARLIALAKAKNDNGMTSLVDFVDTKNFIENPLDVFDSYTYNLELFVVDREANRKFQLEESFIIEDVVTNNWPGPNDNKIIIAKTGVTTEFNITDLTVESLPQGNSNYSKIAGVADKLSFTITQVGETSLTDNLQNAVLLCGFTSISTAIYYIKINFVGHKDGKSEKINQTKVLPFKISKYHELSTSTDARGTTTVIDGQSPADAIVMDIDVSNNEYGFDFKVGSTLKETLDTFFVELNKSVTDNHITLDANLKHSYSYEFSTQFKDVGFSKGSMLGVSWDQVKNFKKKGKNDAEPVGQVLPQNLIYGVIEEICLISEEVRKELKRNSHTTNKVLKITPNLAIKTDGYNPVEGKNSYDVKFFIDYEEKVIDQNMPNQQAKILSYREVLQQLFDNLHVNKKYDYLFTGNNDQILDFSISLDSQLLKTYSTPDDFWAYEHFIKEGAEGKHISGAHREIVDKNAAEAKRLKDIDTELQKAKEDATTMLANQEYTYKSQIINAYYKFYGHKVMHQKGNATNNFTDTSMPPSEMEDIFAGKSYIDLETQFENEEFMKEFDTGYMDARLNQLHSEVVEAQKLAAKSGEEYQAAQTLAEESYMDAVSSTISSKHNKASKGIQSAFEGVKNANKNPKKLILAEELDNDFVSKISNDDYRTILKAQASNPITFQRLIRKMGAENRSYTLKAADDIDLELVKAKYYESKQLKPSMIHAQITIKGDPYWLEGYMPIGEKTLKKTFGNGGGDKQGLNIQTTKNGWNGMILTSGVTDGVDLHDNILKRNLITSLYAVSSMTSSFSNGIFTQTLMMVKNTTAEHFTSDAGVVSAGQLTERTDTNDANLEVDIDATYTTGNYEGDYEGVVVTGADGVHRDVLGRDLNGYYYVGDGKMESVEVIQERMYNKIEEEGPNYVDRIVAAWQRVFDVELNEKMGGENERMENLQQDIVDTLAVTPVNPALGQHDAILLDNWARWNNSLIYLENTRKLRDACATGLAPSSCEQVTASEATILETLGLTIEDKGKASTITAINDYFNDVIADPATDASFVLSAQEVAMYQIAGGGELNITGHNSDNIQKLVVDATGERTPTVILEEISNGTHERTSSEPLGATVDNSMLNGNTELVNKEATEVLINLPTYTWNEKKYRDQITYPNSNGDWKATHWFEETVDNVVAKEKVFNPETRKLEIVKTDADTLTVSEAGDVKVLVDEIKTIIEKTPITVDDVVREQQWYERTTKAIVENIEKEKIVVSDDVRRAMNFRAAAQIRKAEELERLTEKDFVTVETLAQGINDINASVKTGHRGDIGKAISIGKIQGELVTSGLKQDAILNKTYYFDPSHRVVDAISLEELEFEAAVLELGLPAEKITAVATKVTGNDTTYVPIQNPVAQIEVDKAPILVKTALNTMDIILPGSLKSRYSKNFAGEGIGWEYAMANPNKVTQYNEAKKIYKLITSYDIGDRTTVTDDMGNVIEVKDFSNIAPIIYTDANGVSTTISNPSTFFGIYTTTYDDMNPSYSRDYDALKEKIADLFPDIKSGQESQLINGKLPTKKDGRLEIIITGDKFYIDPTP